MRCCHCNNQIEQKEIDNETAHELMGVISHVTCDNEQLARQEKLVKYTKGHILETEQI